VVAEADVGAGRINASAGASIVGVRIAGA
jgi:hypothetical protein